MDPIQSPQKLWKLIGHFKKAPILSQTQAPGYNPRGTEKLSLSLLLVTSTDMVHSPVLSMASRREPEYESTAMDCIWKCTKLSRCWTGQYFNMEHKLWAMAFTLALLKPRLDFSHCKTDGDRTLGSQEGNPLNYTSSICHTVDSYLPM